MVITPPPMRDPGSSPFEHFNAARWLREVGDSPGDVAQALEFAHLFDIDRVAEALLFELVTDLVGTFPERRPSGRLPWRLPQWQTHPRLSRFFPTHLAVALGLAARSESASARRIRCLRDLAIPSCKHWWITDSLEHFGNLARIQTLSPWHPEARLPARFLCLPQVDRLVFCNAHFGDARLAACTWNLPRLLSLNLSFNNLTRVPPAIAGLASLQQLNLVGNPLTEVPEGLADLPDLQLLDLRATKVRALPARLAARAGIEVRLG
jgi:Leucine-rich repeat (LRR) protein